MKILFYNSYSILFIITNAFLFKYIINKFIIFGIYIRIKNYDYNFIAFYRFINYFYKFNIL